MKKIDLDHEDINNSLLELCRECGETLKPVFGKINTEKILFIPHGFLHLVPIHASKLDDKFLFQEKVCMYLPYWGLAPAQPYKANTKGEILIANWDRELDLKDLIRLDWSNKINQNTADDFFTMIENNGNPPSLLVLYSHGQGNYLNPYHSRFLLKNSPLTHQRILQDLPEAAVQGSKVVLTACESDLVNASFGLVDEHLSLVNAFLQKGTKEVIGALYACGTDVANEIIQKVKQTPQKPLYELLTEKQQEWLAKWKENKMIKIAVFRTIGFPG